VRESASHRQQRLGTRDYIVLKSTVSGPWSVLVGQRLWIEQFEQFVFECVDEDVVPVSGQWIEHLLVASNAVPRAALGT
jgi:hypothetical protein